MEAICRKTFDRRIAVDIELGATLLQVSGDPTQLEQMLLNLCNLNARDALQAVREPAIRIAAGRIDSEGGADPEGTHVLLRVSNNGMQQEKLPNGY